MRNVYCLREVGCQTQWGVD